MRAKSRVLAALILIIVAHVAHAEQRRAYWGMQVAISVEDGDGFRNPRLAVGDPFVAIGIVCSESTGWLGFHEVLTPGWQPARVDERMDPFECFQYYKADTVSAEEHPVGLAIQARTVRFDGTPYLEAELVEAHAQILVLARGERPLGVQEVPTLGTLGIWLLIMALVVAALRLIASAHS